jgi:hypothetical protein
MNIIRIKKLAYLEANPKSIPNQAQLAPMPEKSKSQSKKYLVV